MENLFDKFKSSIKENGIIPVFCPKSEEELKTFINAIIKTPINCVEITLRNPFSSIAISYIKKNFPQIIVGAGTVVSSKHLNLALENGADFCVSPGFDEEIIAEAQNKNIAFLPGCSTPSDILKAQKQGINTVKFFPAECSGGTDALTLYEGAFNGVSFLPTGGITLNNFTNYLKCKNVIACGGSFMIPKTMLSLQNTDGIYKTIMNCITLAKEITK